MDGITEPVVLILGHPIAGNPAQFALERAFESMKLGWRVLSCDIPPNRVGDAIRGAEVLGFRGLLLDKNLTDVVTRERQDSESDNHDLYWRSNAAEGKWHTESVLTSWLESEIKHHAESRESQIGSLLWIGDVDTRFPVNLVSDQSQSPIAWASADAIEHADVIAISKAVDVSAWPQGDGETLVIDFSNPPNDIQKIESLGYKVLGREQARVGMLIECIKRWTGKTPTVEVLNEAVEEYLAV